MKSIIPILLLFFIACQSNNDWQITQLELDSKEAPLALNNSQPKFGWQISDPEAQQSAYHIQVASSKQLLSQGKADLWDSGKQLSARSQGITYAGKALNSRADVYWRVQLWDQDGKTSKWSEAAHGKVGLLKAEDWEAQWISTRPYPVKKDRHFMGTYEQKELLNPQDTAAILMRRELTVEKEIEQALVHICGLGYHELYVDGQKIGDHVLAPLFSDYQKTIYYETFDLSEMLAQGTHSLGVILGNGFYNLPTMDLFMLDQSNWKTPPKLRLQLEITYSDGEKAMILSDENWQWSTGEIVFNCIRAGETIDARKAQKGWDSPGFDASSWQQVVEVEAPLGELVPQAMPPLRVNKSLSPISMTEPQPGVYLFDFGENMTGWASMQFREMAEGQQVHLWHNEALSEDSSLNKKYSTSHTKGRFQHGIYISDGQKGAFTPRFCYHGFRYVQVEGLPYKPRLDEIEAQLVYTDLADQGSFRCSNERLNELHAAVRRTLLNSVHSMPGEEPTREKMGWTYDAGMVTMEGYLYNFDAISTYKKYLQDLIDAQEPNGHIPPIVPTNGWGFVTPEGKPVLYDDPWWGGTVFYVTDKLFQWTQDTSIIEKAFEPMQRYCDFISSTADDSLLVHWSLGDWLDLKQWSNGWGPGLTPIVQTSTACYAWMSNELAQNARLLGETELVTRYEDLHNRIKANFNHSFLDTETGWYKEGSQTAQAVPLYYGLVPADMEEKVFARLMDAIEQNNYHTSVGFVGVQPLLKYLSENSHIATAYRMVAQEESPGWLHMIQNGDKSTVAENLNAEGYGTGHHPFGSCVGHWFYQYLAGIQVGEQAGWQQFRLQPGIVEALDFVEAEMQTPFGQLKSAWYRENGKLRYEIIIPPNTRAEIVLPVAEAEKIMVNEKTLSQSTATDIDSKDDQTSFQLAAGTHKIMF